ncbi:hypothetical protein FIU86_20105 [Roseovarius sp. THAF9]|uniref:DUF1217 domain-containing protein n=1 Tax=Roseovarius sp. THAF9 TaxID=2587847 RepID=UPI0012692E1C|nr:DUF1217 domain-containing protein [Roseovarius sp. THAF9]QFT95164.1 hypothetical protein FIU86_20105 [Roseovarius sp. THAF9]
MFQPVIPMSGLAGWMFLQRTADSQSEAFNNSPRIVRDTEYFEVTIGQVTSAEELVEDRRLLRVALGAFGLQDDLNNRYLIRTVLEQGTESNDALANRLSDDRYQRFAEAFGFGNSGGARTQDPLFAADITARFRARSFEVAVGEQNESMRLSLNADRELADLAQSDGSEDTKWFRILGTPPLRSVFETALGLPDGFGQLDIDRQLEIFKDKSRSTFGLENINDLAEDGAREDLVRAFLVRDQLKAISFQSSTSIALTLLQAR